jgi:hypothetical protein
MAASNAGGASLFKQLDQMSSELKLERKLREKALEKARQSQCDRRELLHQLRDAQARANSAASDGQVSADTVAKLMKALEQLTAEESEAFEAADDDTRAAVTYNGGVDDGSAFAQPETSAPTTTTTTTTGDDAAGPGAVVQAENKEPDRLLTKDEVHVESVGDSSLLQQPTDDTAEVTTPVSPEDSNMAMYRSLVSAFYEEHKPEKLKDLDYIFAKYLGKEKQLYIQVCRKYGKPELAEALDSPDKAGGAGVTCGSYAAAQTPPLALFQRGTSTERGTPCRAPSAPIGSSGRRPASCARALSSGTPAHLLAAPIDSKWQPDRPECSLCSGSFSMLNKRHHCRQCGQNVCSACSPFRVALTDPVKRPANSGGVSRLFGIGRAAKATDDGAARDRSCSTAGRTAAGAEAHRVCASCHEGLACGKLAGVGGRPRTLPDRRELLRASFCGA